MIFVTVGTHEQSSNRLIQEVDKLKGEGKIEDEVIMQTGYSMYEPKYCKCLEVGIFCRRNKRCRKRTLKD